MILTFGVEKKDLITNGYLIFTYQNLIGFVFELKNFNHNSIYQKVNTFINKQYLKNFPNAQYVSFDSVYIEQYQMSVVSDEQDINNFKIKLDEYIKNDSMIKIPSVKLKLVNIDNVIN